MCTAGVSLTMASVPHPGTPRSYRWNHFRPARDLDVLLGFNMSNLEHRKWRSEPPGRRLGRHRKPHEFVIIRQRSRFMRHEHVLRYLGVLLAAQGLVYIEAAGELLERAQAEYLPHHGTAQFPSPHRLDDIGNCPSCSTARDAHSFPMLPTTRKREIRWRTISPCPNSMSSCARSSPNSPE